MLFFNNSKMKPETHTETPTPKSKTPNIDRAVQAVYSSRNEYHRDTALRFAKIAIEKDMPLPKKEEEALKVLLDRHIVISSLNQLSEHVLNSYNYSKQFNTKTDVILENMRYKEKLKYIRKGI